MSSLEIEFDPSQEYVRNEVKVGEPYEFIALFFDDELDRRIDAARHWMQYAKDALSGKPVSTGHGNAWGFDADAETATFTNLYIDEPENTFTIPTPLLVEAFERWIAYLEQRDR